MMTTTQESLKDKYWNDQIKSMLGPCMITFAIPITIPGVTITLVAFSEEKSLPKYGALHVTGLILLIVSVFLILLGCILKYMWKPFIPIDIEMQLTPHPSLRNVSGPKSKNKLDGIYRDKEGKNNRQSVRDSDSSSIVVPPVEISRLENESRRADDLLASARSDETPSCSGLSAVQMESDETDIVRQRLKMIGSDDGTGSEDEPKYSHSAITDANPIRRLPSSNSRHLPPISPRPLTSQEVEEKSPSLNEIETWRKKKRKKRKKKQPSDVSVDEGSDQGVFNQASDCDESVVKRSKHELTVERDTEEASGGSARSSNRSLLPDDTKDKDSEEVKRKKRRKKKKRLSSLKQSSMDRESRDNTESNDEKEYHTPLRMTESVSHDDEGDRSDN